MKTPQKTPPAQQSSATVLGGDMPSLVVSGKPVSLLDSPNAPALPPPNPSSASANASKVDVFGAAAWQSDKRVNALYTTYHTRNAWMSIADMGWVKLTVANDSACEAMNVLAANARTKNSRIDYSVDGGQVNEMYVW